MWKNITANQRLLGAFNGSYGIQFPRQRDNKTIQLT